MEKMSETTAQSQGVHSSSLLILHRTRHLYLLPAFNPVTSYTFSVRSFRRVTNSFDSSSSLGFEVINASVFLYIAAIATKSVSSTGRECHARLSSLSVLLVESLRFREPCPSSGSCLELFDGIWVLFGAFVLFPPWMELFSLPPASPAKISMDLVRGPRKQHIWNS